MNKSSFQMITDFFSHDRKEFIECYLLAECRLRESNPNYIDNIRRTSFFIGNQF